MGKNSADSAVRKKRRILAAFLLLAAAMAAGILLNICIGSVSVSLSEILKILSGQPMGEKQQTIILQLRLPRTILAAVLGGALALSGYLLQTFFHNPIAGPFVLGISSGAKMVVALVMVFFLGRGRMVNSAGMIAAAFAGGDAFHGLCPVDVEADQADVHAGGQRRDDRIYLLGGNGAGRDVCAGCGHCKSS